MQELERYFSLDPSFISFLLLENSGYQKGNKGRKKAGGRKLSKRSKSLQRAHSPWVYVPGFFPVWLWEVRQDRFRERQVCAASTCSKYTRIKYLQIIYFITRIDKGK